MCVITVKEYVIVHDNNPSKRLYEYDVFEDNIASFCTVVHIKSFGRAGCGREKKGNFSTRAQAKLLYIISPRKAKCEFSSKGRKKSSPVKCFCSGHDSKVDRHVVCFCLCFGVPAW